MRHTNRAGAATLERRTRSLELREEVRGSNGRQRWATAVTYRTVDSYGTTWSPGVFRKALAERMPVILYGHDWNSIDSVLGKGIDSRERDYGVDVLMEFADPNKIPAARTAIHLVADKILTDVSVGFMRLAWRDGGDLTAAEHKLGAKEAIDEAVMDELSLVVVGAVPGAAVRRRTGQSQVERVLAEVRGRRPNTVPDALLDDPVVSKWLARADADRLGDKLRMATELYARGQL
ncbi:MAG TPA: HK97 family phage prohead protease [Ilumatobacter sp.]|nr:HK97 family phage prohead protease [Ilumatobacter sp.]